MAKTMVDKNCVACDAPFQSRLDQHKRGDGKYCSYACRNIGRARPAVDRFWRHVQKTDYCWVWTGSCNEHGYGQLNVSGKPKKTHILSYEMAYGSLPVDKPWVLHRCDNPPCVRPDHLFPGTMTMNTEDKVQKNRQCRGSDSHLSILTETIVREIRTIYATRNWTQSQLAARYGVSQSAIYYAISRRTWKHVLP